jgi:hypothetical protein
VGKAAIGAVEDGCRISQSEGAWVSGKGGKTTATGNRRSFMYLAYTDDSGSDKKSPTIVIGAVLISHQWIQEIETVAGLVVENLIPKDRIEDFKEFHTCELFGGYGTFEGIALNDRRKAITALLQQVKRFAIPFIYSAVNKKNLAVKAFGSANAMDCAFRMCVLGIEDWLREHDDREGLGLLICDDTKDGTLKAQMRSSFRLLRPRILPPDWRLGRLTHLHDDMYFGASREAIGIQIADVCTWVIHRSLGQDDVPDLYEEIAEHITCSKVDPDWSQNRDIFLEYNPNAQNIA